MTIKRVGLIVNPIAGMGGRVGLKGTDGPAALEQARALGATPLSEQRAGQALSVLRDRIGDDLLIVTPAGPMGGDIARSLGISFVIPSWVEGPLVGEHPVSAGDAGQTRTRDSSTSVGMTRETAGMGEASLGRSPDVVIPSRAEGPLVGEHPVSAGDAGQTRTRDSSTSVGMTKETAGMREASVGRSLDVVIPSRVEGSLVGDHQVIPGTANQDRPRDSSTSVGMTKEPVGMTKESVGMTKESVGMTKEPVGMTKEPVGMTEAAAGPTVQTVGATTSADTRIAAAVILSSGVDLLLFAGGDGTARDLFEAAGNGPPVLGIPTGVKMHSAVYATTPRAAGEAAVNFLTAAKPKLRESEVMDIDEDAFRAGRLSARLYGYLQVPAERALVQSLKSGSTSGEGDLAGIAADIAERMQDGALWIMAPGTTTRSIAERLGIRKTLLGVDLVSRGELVESDAAEHTILRHLDGVPARILVTPIGGQGYLFGRGNQQISPAVIRRVGREHIVVVATSTKLTGLRGGPLLVDTGDPALDAELSGYIRVVTGYRQESVQRVA